MMLTGTFKKKKHFLFTKGISNAFASLAYPTAATKIINKCQDFGGRKLASKKSFPRLKWRRCH